MGVTPSWGFCRGLSDSEALKRRAVIPTLSFALGVLSRIPHGVRVCPFLAALPFCASLSGFDEAGRWGGARVWPELSLWRLILL